MEPNNEINLDVEKLRSEVASILGQPDQTTGEPVEGEQVGTFIETGDNQLIVELPDEPALPDTNLEVKLEGLELTPDLKAALNAPLTIAVFYDNQTILLDFGQGMPKLGLPIKEARKLADDILHNVRLAQRSTGGQSNHDRTVTQRAKAAGLSRDIYLQQMIKK